MHMLLVSSCQAGLIFYSVFYDLEKQLEYFDHILGLAILLKIFITICNTNG